VKTVFVRGAERGHIYRDSTSSDGLSVFAEKFVVVELTDTQGVEPGLSLQEPHGVDCEKKSAS